MSNSANDTQVGGSHYKSSIQHWDFVAARGLGYFEGQVTKYLARWRKKNGVQDIQKARHFLAKLLELAPQLAAQAAWRKHLDEMYTQSVMASSAPSQMPKPPLGLPYISTLDFLDANGIDDRHDREAIMAVAEWGGDMAVLRFAFTTVSGILDRAEAEQPSASPDGRLLEIARRHVAVSAYDYAPKNAHEVSIWHPHPWVMAAMREASGR